VEVFDQLPQALHRFGIGSVRDDACAELLLQVGVAMGEQPAFDARLVRE